MELIKTYNEENIFKTQFTGSGMAILTLLVLSLIGLGERVLYDLGRTFAAPIGDFGYFDNPKVIIVHAIFIVTLLVVTISLNYIFGRKREKYAIALIPYFVTSIVLAIQLAIQLGVYFTTHHTNLQFYLVMSLLVLVSSYGIFHIQNNYKKTHDTTQTNNTGLLAICVVLFALFAVLILSFNTRTNQNNTNTMYSNSYYPDMGQQYNNQQQTLPIVDKNVSGDYVIDFQYVGTSNLHDVSLMQDNQGNLSGNGGNPAAGAHVYKWVITSGTVLGNSINFSAQYTAPGDAVTPQAIMDVNGTISQDGTMSGTWSDNYRGQSRVGNFYTVTSGFKQGESSNQTQIRNVVGNDNYPRIMYYQGNVNQHYDTSARSWMTDLDGVSGPEIDKLTYCKKYYPHTISITPYRLETPPAWRPYGGNGAGFNATVVSDLCVQPN